MRVVVDSSAGLPPEVAEEYGIAVLNMHLTKGGTAGLSALELCACYARMLERGGDAGVVALHVPKELSSTWSAAVEASALFHESVRVVDTPTLGMGVGAAAVAAAQAANKGGDLEECYEAAIRVLDSAATFLYAHRLDELRRSGRVSAGTMMISTALASKPIMRVREGRVELAVKTRTQTRAFERLTELAVQAAGDKPVRVFLQEHEAREASRKLAALLEEALPEGSEVRILPLADVLAAHAGPGAIAVSIVDN
ncbi:DegV domain-containing protein [Corynebacterium lowii]|uniref:DegV domain-containing protein n=1 Tax=Corynebacterium lowii TaxID=1544413 RepID=A0A0Q0U4N8_9CORY|nr:DegV domain-containing protein [Corynebacterium lowii]